MQNMASTMQDLCIWAWYGYTFDIRPEDDIECNTDIWVDVQTPPVIPLCKFLNHIYVFVIVYSKIVDN